MSLETILLMPDGARSFEQTFIFINDLLKKPCFSSELRGGDVFRERLEFRGQRFISAAERHVRQTRRQPTAFKPQGVMK